MGSRCSRQSLAETHGVPPGCGDAQTCRTRPFEIGRNSERLQPAPCTRLHAAPPDESARSRIAAARDGVLMADNGRRARAVPRSREFEHVRHLATRESPARRRRRSTRFGRRWARAAPGSSPRAKAPRSHRKRFDPCYTLASRSTSLPAQENMMGFP